jgi:hypothetical protein
VLQSLQNSTVAMYITVCYHQSATRSRRGGVRLYAQHHVLLILSSINQRGAGCAVRGAGTVLCYTYMTVYFHQLHFNNQRGIAGSAGETQEAGRGAVLRIGNNYYRSILYHQYSIMNTASIIIIVVTCSAYCYGIHRSPLWRPNTEHKPDETHFRHNTQVPRGAEDLYGRLID